ncbi:MAG: M20/M25/M40 family metallo-hydrolase [Verrucomicrobiota bacterium]
MKESSKSFLKTLLNTASPSSGEAPGQRVWLNYVKPFADLTQTDAYGNAVAILNPDAKIKILVAGHADEIAFQVQYIDDKGFVYFSPVGGQDPSLARGQRVLIHSSKGPVLGVIGGLAIHLQDRSKKQEAPAWHEVFVDIGVESKAEAEKRVKVGDLMTYSVGCETLHGDIWAARACDNRIGTFISAEVLRICSEKSKKLKVSLISASTIQEENGLYGAAMVGYSVKPDAAIVVDVGHATDIPLVKHKQFGDIKLGKGPVLSRGSVNHPVLVDHLDQVARKEKIKIQYGIDARYSGTDADAIFISCGGVPTVSLAVPNRYMHTPVELVHLKDLEKMAEWIAAFVLGLDGKESFKVKI